VTWVVDALPASGGKTRASGFRQTGGGMAATAAVAAARLGAEAEFWGRGGTDAAGAAMRDELVGWGVGVHAFRLFEGAQSSISGVIVDSAGERMIVNFRGAELPADPGWLPLDAVARADAVLADPRWPEGALALFDAARRSAVPAILDGDVADAAVFDRLLAHTDYAIFSEPGLAGYAAESGVRSRDPGALLGYARERGCRVAAVTLGEHGVVWDDGRSVQQLSAFPVEVVDTNGAGDVFHGAFAFAIGARWSTRDAFRFSAAVAAIKCTRPGGRSGIPDFAGAMNLLQQFEE
jgi:sulfofructose kinase